MLNQKTEYCFRIRFVLSVRIEYFGKGLFQRTISRLPLIYINKIINSKKKKIK